MNERFEIFVFSKIIGLVKYYNFPDDTILLSFISSAIFTKTLKTAKFHSYHFCVTDNLIAKWCLQQTCKADFWRQHFINFYQIREKWWGWNFAFLWLSAFFAELIRDNETWSSWIIRYSMCSTNLLLTTFCYLLSQSSYNTKYTMGTQFPEKREYVE